MENVRDCEDGRTGRLTARAYLIMGPGGEGEGIRQDDAKGLSECDEVGTGATQPPQDDDGNPSESDLGPKTAPRHKGAIAAGRGDGQVLFTVRRTWEANGLVYERSDYDDGAGMLVWARADGRPRLGTPDATGRADGPAPASWRGETVSGVYDAAIMARLATGPASRQELISLCRAATGKTDGDFDGTAEHRLRNLPVRGYRVGPFKWYALLEKSSQAPAP